MISGVAYSASKFGMAALNQSINVEFREEGIRACCIYPGEVDTPILDHRPNPVSDAKRAAALLPEDIAAAAYMVAQMPDRVIVGRHYHFSTPGGREIACRVLAVRPLMCVR